MNTAKLERIYERQATSRNVTNYEIMHDVKKAIMNNFLAMPSQNSQILRFPLNQ